MTMNLRSFSDKDSLAKKEDDPSGHNKFIPKIPNNYSSRHWSSYKNPRIVRVSRAFGGKDRHSKVCTVRGLKDRRIRLSVPTAIQLYDLQDKLGLSQPSKVVDWLLDATKEDIDKLPPLPMISMHQLAAPSHSFEFTPQPSFPHFISSNYGKDFGISAVKEGIGDQQEGFGGFISQLSAQNLFPLNTTNNNNGNNNNQIIPNLAYNSYFHPNLSLSQSGVSYPFLNQSEDERPHSSLLQPSSDLQYFCPSAIPPLIPSFPPTDSELRQVNQQIMNPFLPTTLSLISNSSMLPRQHVSSRTVLLLENDARRWQNDSSSSSSRKP